MEYEHQLAQIRDTVVQSLSEGLIFIDFEGTIIYANNMALSILDMDEERMFGSKFAELFFMQPENDEFTQVVIDAIYQRGETSPRIVAYHAGEKVRQLRVAPCYLTRQDGKGAGITIILSDLSELIELRDAVEAMRKIGELNHQLQSRNDLLSKTFGQFLSDDIVRELLETPGTLEPGGKNRDVTIMMSDLRGFTGISERMDASDLLIMLNHYYEKMTDIIQGRAGTIIEFIGDGILAVFGAPVSSENHAEDAVCAALEMQSAMVGINQWNAERGYPRLEMGIGLNTGEAIVGIIGCEKRMKYGVLGSLVNQCSRIESYTTRGQILISQSVRDRLRALPEIDKEMRVFPKGLDNEVILSQITGIGKPYDIHIIFENNAPGKLEKPVAICFRKINGKQILDTNYYGGFTALGDDGAVLETETELELFDNLQIDAGGRLLCKVMGKEGKSCLLQYTSIPSGYPGWMKARIQEDKKGR